MDILSKLKGAIQSRKVDKDKLNFNVQEANRLMTLIQRPEWPAFQNVLDRARRRAVQEIGIRGQSDNKLRDANQRLSVLNEIEADIKAVIEIGSQSRKELEMLDKEKRNG